MKSYRNNNYILMQKKKHSSSIIVYIAIYIILASLTIISNVYALGIAPSKVIIDYGLDDEGVYAMNSRVINNEGRDLAVRISATGELSQYVTIPEPLMYVSSDMPEGEFEYTITLPSGISSGTKIIEIMISEIDMRQFGSDGNSVGGLLSITQQVYINIPSQGKYAEGILSTSPTEQQGKVLSIVNINNRGTENIGSITGSILVSDIDGKDVYRKNLDIYKNLGVKQSMKIEEPISVARPGTYRLQYDIRYDGKQMILSKDIMVGEYNVSIAGAAVDSFKLGTVAKFSINTTSNWNTPIDDVYGEIIVKDTSGNIISRTETDRTTINPKDDIMLAYWDTASISSGEYLISIILHAGTQTSTKEYLTLITENEITVTDESVNAKPRDTGKYITITIMLAVSSLLAILLLSVIVPKHKKK